MSRVCIAFVLIISLSFTIITWYFWRKLDNSYSNSFFRIQTNKSLLIYNNIFDEYYSRYSEFPASLDDLKPLYVHGGIYDMDIDSFVDPLSKSNSYYKYCPVYNPKTKKRYGYILYSAGIDGSYQNITNTNDTLNSYDIENKYQFYNNLIPACHSITTDSIAKFNLVTYLFGNKDYLINYIICE